MGLFKRRTERPSKVVRAEVIILKDEDCTELVAAVGESHYQPALRAACGDQKWEDVAYDCIAALVPEPENEHDPNAVMVQVDGNLVAYLSRDDAVAYSGLLAQVASTGRFLACKARIAGRGPEHEGTTSNLGIFLQLPPPEERLGSVQSTGAHPHASDDPDKPGYFRGRHISSYPADVRQLEKEGKVDEAEQLLLKLVEVAEDESTATGTGVNPWPYERLATLCRKQERYKDEIDILERWAKQKHPPGNATPALLVRLGKARRSFGAVDSSVDDITAALGPRVGSADAFLNAIRTARHYSGEEVVSKDAPSRIRGDQAPAYTKVVAPRAVPPYEKRVYDRPVMDQGQQAFYDAWRTDFEAGMVWQAPAGQEQRLVAYGHAYARDLVDEARSDPGAAATNLERLVDAYPSLRDFAPWACDAWLLAGDLKGAFDCLPEPRPTEVRALDMERRLTLKRLLGFEMNAPELFSLYPPKVTPALREHLDALVEIVQNRLDVEHQDGANYLDDLFSDRYLITEGWPLWNASTTVRVIDDARYGRLSKLEAGQALAADLQRAAENALREDMGLPGVGQGWVSETQLFVELRDALDTKVVQHGIPDGFGQQHVDVWIPAWSIGVEYQGLQHFEPVEFFGGEEAFAETVKRDRQKRSKASRLGIELIYVRDGYDLDEVIAEVEAARADPSGP